jgi:acetylornithine deacetylase/succinyl-diaminopimelate desuccinylase-like protein
MIQNYIEQHKQRFLDELFELLRIPSISADPAYSKDVFRAAEYVKDKMIAAGADNVEACPTEGYPIVYGEKIFDPKLPTVLVYGHYDVQPAVPLELWHTPPFEPTIKKQSNILTEQFLPVAQLMIKASFTCTSKHLS